MKYALALMIIVITATNGYSGPGYYGGGDYTEYYRNSWTYSFGFPSPYPGKIKKDAERTWTFSKYSRQYSKAAASNVPAKKGIEIPLPENPSSATFIVEVPEKADLWIDSKKSLQTGKQRVIFSPALKPGRVYGYKFKATWLEEEQEVVRERDVLFLIGETVNVQLDK